ncbi:DUF397 domain-containing protein [Streptomyces iakyrus]|uniref:DUF397 domain-containing protein n=1 Tax=Streptomyces iakyrus TaxID=68219 RepID=UPI0036E2A46B
MSQKWTKSTYSAYENCVEVSQKERGMIVRDSKYAASEAVTVEVSETAWRIFISDMRS